MNDEKTHLETGGGPAFPNPEMSVSHFGHAEGYTGMSLRDYFAGQALVGLLAGHYSDFPREAPIKAYQIADAMLARRAEGGPQ
jgi:hypothetical protein